MCIPHSKMKKRTIIFIILVFTLFIYLNMSVMGAYEVETYPIEKVDTFDEYIRTDYRDEISKEKPAIVAIGDSAIRELDEDAFSRVLGEKTKIFSAPGTGSAYWYLFFRNEVLTAKQEPDLMFFFFRSVTLTTPSYLVSGSYYTRLEEVAVPSDSDVYAIAIESAKNPLHEIPEKYIPLFAFRSEIYQNLVTQTRNYLPAMLLNCDSDCVDNAFDQVFDEYQINALLWEELVLNLDSALNNELNYDFGANVDSSLLPMILKESRNAGIIPVFIRTKYRSQALGDSDSPELDEYMQDLKDCIQRNGGLFIDLADADELTADMYRDEMHLNLDDASRASEIIARYIYSYLDFLLD